MEHVLQSKIISAEVKKRIDIRRKYRASSCIQAKYRFHCPREKSTKKIGSEYRRSVASGKGNQKVALSRVDKSGRKRRQSRINAILKIQRWARAKPSDFLHLSPTSKWTFFSDKNVDTKNVAS